MRFREVHCVSFLFFRNFSFFIFSLPLLLFHFIIFSPPASIYSMLVSYFLFPLRLEVSSVILSSDWRVASFFDPGWTSQSHLLSRCCPFLCLSPLSPPLSSPSGGSPSEFRPLSASGLHPSPCCWSLSPSPLTSRFRSPQFSRLVFPYFLPISPKPLFTAVPALRGVVLDIVLNGS